LAVAVTYRSGHDFVRDVWPTEGEPAFEIATENQDRRHVAHSAARTRVSSFCASGSTETTGSVSEPLSLDDFVRLVDSMGPKKIPRVTNYEAAFMKQLVKKDAL